MMSVYMKVAQRRWPWSSYSFWRFVSCGFRSCDVSAEVSSARTRACISILRQMRWQIAHHITYTDETAAGAAIVEMDRCRWSNTTVTLHAVCGWQRQLICRCLNRLSTPHAVLSYQVF